MAIIVVNETTLDVGNPTMLEGTSPSEPFSVVFEDDGDTGYLYGLDLRRDANPICDSLHIYNVKDVADRQRPSTLTLAWSQDGLKAVLLINDFPHAVFDFEECRGYCRTGFPPSDPGWTSFSHDWDDTALSLFH
jgi:hypothetical protein